MSKLPPADNLMFASVKLPSFDKKAAAKAILAVDDSFTYWDEYRHTKMVPLMTKNAGQGLAGSLNTQQGDFAWVDYAPQSVREYFDQVIFPWIGMESRVMALITQPGFTMFEHIDCGQTEINTRQHKFRIVAQGDTGTLYYKTTKGDIHAPSVDGPFIIDGGWPHGMTNSTPLQKVTICLGAPWTGKDTYGDDLELLLNRDDYEMPADLTPFWRKA